MNDAIEIKVPDIGDFKEIDVIEVLVKSGDTVAKETSLITVESDKATMEIPSPAAGVVKELQDWGFIGAVDVVDPSWVDVAYTWNRPGSAWVSEATAALAEHDIRVAGRYARWNFQGITDSLRDGFLAGQALRMNA